MSSESVHTPSRKLTGWITAHPVLARHVYRAPAPLSVRSDIDLRGTDYETPRGLFNKLQQINGLECVIRGREHHVDCPDVNQYRRTDAFEGAVEAHTDPLDEREGLCIDADCARQRITWPDDTAGPRCPCGARLRAEVGDDE